MNNAQFLAYPPVVAAGNNANTIHYINNTQIAKNGELVLMDAGNEKNALKIHEINCKHQQTTFKRQNILTDKNLSDCIFRCFNMSPF